MYNQRTRRPKRRGRNIKCKNIEKWVDVVMAQCEDQSETASTSQNENQSAMKEIAHSNNLDEVEDGKVPKVSPSEKVFVANGALSIKNCRLSPQFTLQKIRENFSKFSKKICDELQHTSNNITEEASQSPIKVKTGTLESKKKENEKKETYKKLDDCTTDESREIKREFCEEEIKIECNEIQLHEEKTEEHAGSSIKVQDLNVLARIKEETKMQWTEVKNVNNEKNKNLSLSMVDGLDEVKSEICEEEIKIEYGESELHDETILKLEGSSITSHDLNYQVLTKSKKDISHSIHKEKRPYPCDYCYTRFTFKYALKEHERKFHPDKQLKNCQKNNNKMELSTRKPKCIAGYCEICGELVDDLKNHKLGHPEDKPYECKICGGSYRTERKLRMHCWEVHENRPHQCDVCGKQFVLEHNLLQHRTSHIGEERVKCDLCTKSFGREEYLKLHMKTHSEKRPHKCRSCDKCFKYKYNLNQHELKIHGLHSYKCNICETSFKTRFLLKQHRNVVHLKFHQCEVCNKTFQILQSLIEHEAEHRTTRQ